MLESLLILYGLFFVFCLLKYVLHLTFIYVSSDYINYVYAAQVTISSIIITVVALLSSSLSDSYLGFTLRDILTFSFNPIRPRLFVCLSLINILLNTSFYIFDLIDCITSMLVITVILSLCFSSIIVQIFLKNEQFLYDRIQSEIRNCEDDIHLFRYTLKIESYINYLSKNQIENSDEELAWALYQSILERQTSD